MYGLPKDFDGAVFVGLELERVSFTVNTVYLGFESDTGINLTSSFTYRIGPEDPVVTELIPMTSSGVIGLLGKRVALASARADGELILTFEGGGLFRCSDDLAPAYESYSIRIRDERIIV